MHEREDQSLSKGDGPCVSRRLIRVWLALALGPAGRTRGERSAESGRNANGCGESLGDAKALVNNEDGGTVEERRGGEARREETKGLCTCICRDELGPAFEPGGMDGSRYLLVVPLSLSGMPCAGVPVRDLEREFELERELELDLGLEPAGDDVRVYGGGETDGTLVFRCGGGSDGFGD